MDTVEYKATVTDAFNRAAPSYDRVGVEFFGPMGRRLVEKAAPRTGDRVLDVGCGRGAALLPAAAVVGDSGRAVGVDIAEAMVEQARAEARRQGLSNVEVMVMDGEAPAFPPGSFDLVLGSYSVIFLPDAPGALARYRDLLVDGGRVAFTSPVFSDDTFPFLPPVFNDIIPRSVLERLPEQWHPEQLRRRFNAWLADPADLTAALARAGFTDVRIEDEPVALVARSGAAWVDWSHTQGMRLLWTHLPAEESQQLQRRVAAALDAMRDGDGPLTIEAPVRYVLARTAAR